MTHPYLIGLAILARRERDLAARWPWTTVLQLFLLGLLIGDLLGDWLGW